MSEKETETKKPTLGKPAEVKKPEAEKPKVVDDKVKKVEDTGDLDPKPKAEGDKPNTGTEQAKEIGKTVETEGPVPKVETDKIDDKEYADNKHIGSSEGTKPAESPSHAGNERDTDDGAGGIRATMGNQSLARVEKVGTPNSPDSTNRDVPADATRAEAAVLTRAPADHLEENYPDDNTEHNPYEELSAKDEADIQKQLDDIDEDERKRLEAVEKGMKPYITPIPTARTTSPIGNYLRHHQHKSDETVVYGLGKLRLTIGDLRGETKVVDQIAAELNKRGKKSNFPISMGEGPKLTLADIED